MDISVLIIPLIPFFIFQISERKETIFLLFIHYIFAIVFSFILTRVIFEYLFLLDYSSTDYRFSVLLFFVSFIYCFGFRYAVLEKKANIKTFTYRPLVLLFLNFLSFFLLLAIKWYNKVYNLSFKDLIGTIAMPLIGTSDNVTSIIVSAGVKFVIISFVIAFAIFFIVWKKAFFHKEVVLAFESYKISLIKIFRFSHIIFSIFVLLYAFISVNRTLKLIDYYKLVSQKTEIYEKYYVYPNSVQITKPSKMKNLIYIYLESMETTYASKDVGGRQTENYIPNLSRLAKENINFSASDGLGGAYSLSGAGWTMGSLFSSSSGIPFAFPIGGNSMDQAKSFASGVIAIGDILKGFGYFQEFLCGSDGNFAGRKQFFEQHGDYNVFDIFEARRQKYISDDYWVWWGFEDSILFKIAKDELLKLSSKNQPFNFTMLTVDTHHVGGYICSLCGNDYSERLCNVLQCQDKQLNAFIEWCRNQDFYENTVIVITGDHPRMDTILVEGVPYHERYVYNCFINADKNVNSKKRQFGVIDLFPTVLSAMGFNIEGERLGLGTNLFSEKKTLCEELGVGKFNAELSKYSVFYLKNFP